MKTGSIVLLVLLFLASCLAETRPAQTEVDLGVEQEVRDVQSRRFAAMTEDRLDELDAILADDMTYVHSNGVADTKEEFLSSLRSGAVRYRSVVPHEMVFRLNGRSAVVTGRADVQVTAGGQDIDIPLRFVELYVKGEGGWQLALWQSTRLPQ